MVECRKGVIFLSSKKRRSYSSVNTSEEKNINQVQNKSKKSSTTGITTVYAPKNRIEGIAQSVSKNPLFLILCFFVPFIIMTICFISKGIYPFGDQTVLYSDCKAQYFPFIQELQNKLQNGGSLLYSWNTGMGSNFMAMIGYYIASPLNFLTVFIPEKFMTTALAVIIMTKLSCASLFTGIFIKNVFKRNDISLVAFGCCYAFCSFTMGYYWNIIWLDGVALLPLVALGVYNLVFNKKYKLYIISLAIAMTANYYIGFMLCVFTALWFFMLWIKYPNYKEKKKDFLLSLGSIALYSVIAIGISAVIVLPSYLQLGNTVASNDTITFSQFFEAYGGKEMINILGSMFGFQNPVTMQGLPNIYSGMICIALFGIYLGNSRISSKEKVVDIVFIVFMFLSLYLNGMNYLWHGMHFPNQIPYRFAFIFCFFMIITAYRGFTVSDSLSNGDLAVSGVVAVIMLIIGLIASSNKDEYATLTINAVLVSLAAIVIYILLLALRKSKLVPHTVFVAAISIIVIVEMIMSCFTGVKTVGTSNMDYPNKLNAVQAALSYIGESDTDKSFYRNEMTDISSKNDGVYYGYHSISQFSSTSDKRMIDFMAKFGITSKRSSWHYMQSSPLANSFFNIKHLISRDGYTGNDSTLTYVTSIESDSVLKEISENAPTESVDVYDNNYYLPLGFMVNSDTSYIDVNRYGYALDLQNDLFSKATGLEGNIFNEFKSDSYSISSGTIEPLEGGREGEFTYTAPGTSEKATFEYTVPTDGMVYAYVNFRDCATRIQVSSETISRSVDIDARRYVWPAGDYKAGDKITFSSDLSVGASGTLRIFVATFDKALFEKGYAMLNDETLQMSEYTDTYIKGTINAKQDGIMWTSIPYEIGGWKLYVDGNEQNITELCNAFIGARLTSGEHTVELKYQPPGLTAGIAVTCVSLIGFAALIAVEIIRRKKSEKKITEKQE